jgi:hypothetical protein
MRSTRGRIAAGTSSVASSKRRAFRRTGARFNVDTLRGSDGAPVRDDVDMRRQREPAVTGLNQKKQKIMLSPGARV